mmetsp:Transcript_27272/g.49003  ORF Transcript_27272/g.49003 Transcript_27272/m.49003 type:complete len:82 (-) Transcript_27272:342-587(-)
MDLTYKMEIEVRLLSGKAFNLSVEQSETVEAVKGKIQEHEGIPPDHMRLIFQGSELKNHDSMEASGVSHQSVVNVAVNLRC